jgi:hypothetical protein
MFERIDEILGYTWLLVFVNAFFQSRRIPNRKENNSMPSLSVFDVNQLGDQIANVLVCPFF